VPPLHTVHFFLKCVLGLGLSPMEVELDNFPINFESFPTGVSPQKDMHQDFMKVITPKFFNQCSTPYQI
jgi:hypothetical protein